MLRNKITSIIQSLSLQSWIYIGASLLSVGLLLTTVNLTPQIDDNFFFSNTDPQFQSDQQISTLFKRQDGQFIVNVTGDIFSEDYQKKIHHFSELVLNLPGVRSVNSLSMGPANVKDAVKSPLWSRLLIDEEQKSSNIIIILDQSKSAELVPKIENLANFLESEEFGLQMSGFPYVVELIKRYLTSDIQTFTVLTFCIFGFFVLLIFQSWSIVVGMYVSCMMACIYTLIISSLFGSKIGLLTANLTTIVFVLTLSHIIFITFNWKNLKYYKSQENAVKKAVALTFSGSFWSMTTTLIGFISLFFVQAKPLRELGISGSIGTVLSLIAAYVIYPAFLVNLDKQRRVSENQFKEYYDKSFQILQNHQTLLLTIVVIVTVVCLPFITQINTDPSLLSYFSKKSDLRQGLEYIDANGGSSPMNLVFKAKDGSTLNTNKAYYAMWDMQKNLENHSSVGTILSLPTLLAEGKRNPLGKIMASEWLIDMMEAEKYDEISKSFVTDDRQYSMFIMRMKEESRSIPRLEVIQQIKDIVHAHGFEPHLIGGVYSLQGQLAKLVSSSLIYGLGRLILVFTVIAFIISQMFSLSIAMTICIAIIPACIFGLFGLALVPMDIIAAPASNIAMAIGIDAMIHMTKAFKRSMKSASDAKQAWLDVKRDMWQPVMSAMAMIAIGFGIFLLSSFPPTQRFGGAVVFGTAIASMTALFVFPVLVQLQQKWVKK